jgi:Zn-dependent protease with chaperone function
MQSRQVPKREQLLELLRSANQRAVGILAVQAALVVLLAFLLDWRWVAQHPWIALVSVGIFLGPQVMGLLTFLATAKKEIGDLKETTRFGEFDKYRLQSLLRETLVKLRLSDQRVPVYIVGDKSLNAAAFHIGFGPFLRSLNGIFLNRQVLHKLSAAEVQDIMGHELGHYAKHYLILSRWNGLTYLLGAMVGLWTAQCLGLDTAFSIFVISLLAGGFWWLQSIPYARYSWPIEYLCDDFGAQVNGVVTSVTGLLKLGADEEWMMAVMLKAADHRHAEVLSARELVESIEKAIPYGHAKTEEMEEMLERQLRESREKQGEVSVGGFLRYMWQSDLDREATEEYRSSMEKFSKLQDHPRLDWERQIEVGGTIECTEEQIRKLVELMELNPNQPLFRGSNSIEPAMTHPPLEMRILYLWYNREEIERAAMEGDADRFRI